MTTITTPSVPSGPIRVYHRQFGPLEINPTTGEPFLRLRNHKDIILTPPRSSDAQDLVPHLNDPAVHHWLDGMPIPYSLADGEWFINKVKPLCDETIAKLDEAAREDLQELITVEHSPVKYLRHVQTNEKGEQFDVLIGDVGVDRCGRGELFTPDGGLRDQPDWDAAAKEAFDKGNGPEAMKAGDPRILWEPGYWLASAYHGQGIVPDALNTLIQEWCIPRMGARRFLGLTMCGNRRSQRVFEKNGFVFVKEHQVYKEVRGEERGAVILRLDLKVDSV